jgi:hypothetical protein
MIDMGRMLLFLGLGIAVLGVLVMVAGRLPFLGRLPGDILVSRGGGSFYFPVVTCLVLSLVLTVLLNVAGALFRH